MKINYIQRNLSLKLKSLGNCIGRHPLYFVVVPWLLTSVLATGILRMKYNRNFSYLFTAEKGKTVRDRDIVETLFPTNTSYDADYFRATEEPDGIMIIATPRKGDTMLTYKIFQELEKINQMMKNYTIVWNGKILTYNFICSKAEGICMENPIFKLLPYIAQFEKGRYRFKYPLDIDLFTYIYTRYIVNLGGVTVDENRYVKSAKAIRLLYPFDYSDKTKAGVIRRWEETFTEKLKQMTFEEITVSFIGMNSLEKEIVSFTNDLIPQTLIVGVIIAIFSMVSCMASNWIRSKPWLGVASCISAGLAIFASFGFLFLCGVETTDVNVTLPFLVLATEIDDAYVLIASWRRTNFRESVEKRMGEAYSEAAVSITITSLTNFLSFCIGTTAPFPVNKLFCIYAAVCVLFTYIFQITFFGGCMALSGYREEQHFHPFSCQKVHYERSTTEKSINKETTDEKNFMMKLFQEKLGTILSLLPIKIIILLIFLTNFAFGIWGILHLENGMQVGYMLKSDSMISNSLETTFRYFAQYPYAIQIVINKTLNYADPEIQTTVENIIAQFESHPHVTEPALTLSWLKYYKQFWNNSIAKFSLGSYDLTNKQDFIDGIINVFLHLPPAKQFRQDIIFNEDHTDIIASRFILGSKNIHNRETEIQLLQDLHKICEQSPLPIAIHSMFFPLMEHQILIRGIAFQLAWVIGLLIIGIFFLFIPNLICAICVSVAIVSTICSTVGYMALWNVKLDMVTIILLIVSVGFSINYPTHVSFAFVMAKNMNANERLKQSLYEVGWPIFQGSASTILGVIVLAFQDIYSYLCFFKIVFLTSVQTAFHALFILPVVLSLIHKSNEKNEKGQPISLYNWLTKYKDHFYVKNEEEPYNENNTESEILSQNQSN